MTSKKPPSTKRTALPRTSDYTKTFLKDWERLTRSGRFDMNRLKEAMLLLIANVGPLGAEWLDHPLKGNKAAFRECQAPKETNPLATEVMTPLFAREESWRSRSWHALSGTRERRCWRIETFGAFLR